MKFIYPALLISVCILGCTVKDNNKTYTLHTAAGVNVNFDSTAKTIQVLVALCDNKYQGIVPVPASIGNGQDPEHNLYWGCAYGVKTYFKKSNQLKLQYQIKGNDTLIERLVFKNNQYNYYLIADAYNGKYIKMCTENFFNYCAGIVKDTLHIKSRAIGIGGNAALIAYAGHDGLMDFSLNKNFENADGKNSDAVILACISKKYFAPHLAKTKAYPLLWSTGLMSPEAYTLHDAVNAYINGDDARSAAARVYSNYQHCSIKAAQHLLVSGW